MNNGKIKAEIYPLADGYFAEITGHADTGKDGGREVCAAVSALICSVFGELSELSREGLIRLKAHGISHGSAVTHFTVHENEKARFCAKTAMDVLYKGLCGIEEIYPGMIDLN